MNVSQSDVLSEQGSGPHRTPAHTTLQTTRRESEWGGHGGTWQAQYVIVWTGIFVADFDLVHYSPPSLALTCEKRPERGGTELRSQKL